MGRSGLGRQPAGDDPEAEELGGGLVGAVRTVGAVLLGIRCRLSAEKKYNIKYGPPSSRVTQMANIYPGAQWKRASFLWRMVETIEDFYFNEQASCTSEDYTGSFDREMIVVIGLNIS
ncbi:unnamed protein product [Prorocentrum cordatum]|uniref:Uncharacterized protein n=1 Tax=Prorocentrum cordatum TaxID=2364126 RepID=A0ABN9SIY4_9DINO|nr:unnamed protein product [Polarella glacialis]